jgi:PKD repeat protein
MQTRSQSKLAQLKPSIISTRTAPVTRSSPKAAAPQPSSPVTRSQTKFDFDEASAAWLLNKNKLGNGTYSYKTQKSVVNTGMTTRSGKVLSA